MDLSSAAMIFDNQRMELVMRYAEVMASGKVTTPKHLQGSVGDCAAIVMQAMRWGMDPAPVAQKTHVINGVLGYEAQLVNAVVKQSGEITGRFHYEYDGKSPNLRCRVGAIIKGETEVTWNEWINENTVTTKNSPLWKSNPPQQIGYLQVKNWARAYTPGAILGVYTPDELESFKPPINMGNASEVGSGAKEVDADQLLKEGWAKAEKGMTEFGPWFNSLPKSSEGNHRPTIEPHRAAMLAKAREVDNSRTVDAEIKTPKGSQVVITYAQVMDGLIAAKNYEQLDSAADLIGEVSDPQQRAELTAKYESLQSFMTTE